MRKETGRSFDRAASPEAVWKGVLKCLVAGDGHLSALKSRKPTSSWSTPDIPGVGMTKRLRANMASRVTELQPETSGFIEQLAHGPFLITHHAHS